MDARSVTELTVVAVLFAFTVWAILKRLNEDRIKREKEFEEKFLLEAQELRRKLKSFDVKLGVKKPETFSTKRKPQKTS